MPKLCIKIHPYSQIGNDSNRKVRHHAGTFSLIGQLAGPAGRRTRHCQRAHWQPDPPCRAVNIKPGKQVFQAEQTANQWIELGGGVAGSCCQTQKHSFGCGIQIRQIGGQNMLGAARDEVSHRSSNDGQGISPRIVAVTTRKFDETRLHNFPVSGYTRGLCPKWKRYPTQAGVY